MAQFSRKARNSEKKRLAEISDNIITPLSKKKVNIDHMTNTTKISSELAFKQ